MPIIAWQDDSMPNPEREISNKNKEMPKTENMDLPNNDVLLKERLDEIKEEILQADEKAKGFKSYLADLKSYKDKLSRIDIEKTKKIIENLLQLLDSDPKNKIPGLSKQLHTIYAKLFFESNTLFYKNSDVNDYSRIFMNNNESKIELTISLDLISKLDNLSFIDQDSKIGLSIDDKPELEKLREDLNQKSNVFGSVIEATASEINKVDERVNEAKDELNNLKALRARIIEMLNEKDAAIDSLAITLGLPLFCATILLLFLGPSILKLLSKDKTTEAQPDNSNDTLLEISTVLLLTMSILILALAKQLNQQVLGTLIGGISGYVLNRVSSKRNQS